MEEAAAEQQQKSFGVTAEEEPCSTSGNDTEVCARMAISTTPDGAPKNTPKPQQEMNAIVTFTGKPTGGKRSTAAAVGTESTPRPPMSERQQMALLIQITAPTDRPAESSSGGQSPAAQLAATPYMLMQTPTNTAKFSSEAASASGCWASAPTPYCCSGGRQKMRGRLGSRIHQIHKRNPKGETPLHLAAKKGEHRRCKALLAQGAQVNLADHAVARLLYKLEGWTPLHEACNWNRYKAARVLVKWGADVNAPGAENYTPLHDAAANGNIKLVELLIRHGADKSRRNREGKTPLDLAQYEVVRQLLKAELCAQHVRTNSSEEEDRTVMPSGTAEKGAGNFAANFATSSFNETVTPPPPIDVISPSTSDVQSRSDTSEQLENLRWRRRPPMGRQKSVPLPTKPVKSPSLSSHLRRRDMLHARSSEKKEKYRLVIAAKRRRIDRSTVEATDVAEQRTPASSTGMEVYEFHSSDSEHGTGERPTVAKTSLGSGVIGGTPQALASQGKRRGRPRKSAVAAKLFSDSAAPSSASDPSEIGALVEQQPADTHWLFSSSSVKNSRPVGNEQTSFVTSVDSKMTSAEDEKRVPPLRIVFSSRSSSAEKDCASAGCSSSSPCPQPNAEVAAEPPQAETSKSKSGDGLRLTRSKARLHGVPLARGVGDWSANSARTRHGIRRKVKHGIHQLNASKRQQRSNVSEAIANAEVGLRIGILADGFAAGEGILCSSSSSSTTGSSEPPTNTDLLLSQNGIEAFRMMRSMIEERWFEPPPVPTTTTVTVPTAAGGGSSSLECARPPCVKKTYLSKERDRLTAEDNSSTNVDSSCRTASIVGPTSTVRTGEFAELLENQRQQRERLQKQHVVQRERLTLFAEQQMMRAASRQNSPLSASCRLSVARILRDAEIYNPHQLDQVQRPADVPVPESEESVVARLRRLKTALIRRQKLEADCMRSNQVLEFETAQRRWQRSVTSLQVDNKTEHAVVASDHVPLLSVTEQFCHDL